MSAASSLHTKALAFAESLHRGFVHVDEVARWIEAAMGELAKPPIALIEACAAGQNDDAVVRALRSLPGEVDEREVVRRCFHHASDALLRDDRCAEAIGEWLEEGPGGVAIRGDDFHSFAYELELIASGASNRARTDVVRALVRALRDAVRTDG